MSAIRTAIEVSKDGLTRSVYHERKAPPDKRRADGGGVVTHAWDHPDTEAERAGCAACTSGLLPKEAR